MADSSTLAVANSGDVLSGAELQESVNQLIEMADGLNPLLAAETSVEAAQEIGRAQQKLRSLATSLVTAQIDFLAGQVKVTAAHINAAVDYANGVVSQIADWKRRLDKIGALVDFFGVVLTGEGGKILHAAGKLKAALDTN